MASIRQDKRTGRYLILFRYSGRQFQRGLKTTSRKAADAARARVDETIRLLERGRLEIPDDADPATFIHLDGTQTKKPATRKQLTLGELLQTYDEGRIERVKEDTTITTERIHLKHLRKYLPLRNAAQSITTGDVQRYVG
ncbi:MAG: hypothetical protein ABI614_14730, partial [Planctomycetota bacterium]